MGMSPTPNTPLADTVGSLLSLATAIVIVLVLDRIYRIIKTHEQRTTLKRIAARAVQECRATPQTCLAQASDDEAVYTVSETQDLFKRSTLSPSQNILNLATRCRKYGRGKVNAITEELYDAAYEIAQTLDENTHINKTGPLYGIPVSIKDCINQKDCYASAGLACRMNQRSGHDAVIVRTLKNAGAIPLCRGNIPQLLMSMESNNFVWGRTSNPWDLTRAPGGSTGGDAALVAMGCVPLAAGSDTAGSCRIPASFCGIVGFKATASRVSLKGCMRPRKNNGVGASMTIPVTAGPLGRTVDDCAAFMKAVCSPEMWNGDLTIPRLSFDDGGYKSTTSLKIGYFKTDDWFTPCAAARRGLDETIDALQKQGHTLVPFEPPMNGWEAVRLLVGVNAADGCMRGYCDGLEGEEFCDEYKFLYTIANTPSFVRFWAKFVIDKRHSWLLDCARTFPNLVWFCLMHPCSVFSHLPLL